MVEISPAEFHKAAPIFQSIDHSKAIVHAVLEQNSAGRIFVDDWNAPAAALLLAEGAFFFIGGDEENEAVAKTLAALIFDQILPRALEKEIVLFSFSSAWRRKLDGLFREKGVVQIYRKVFKFNPEKFSAHRAWRAGLPQGFTLRAIDEQLAEQYPAYQPVIDPKSRRLGVCLMRGDEIISECASIFVGGGEAEIDIHTRENYQGRGYATLTASAFIEACLERGLRPNWSCWPERLASRVLAKKLGFEEQADLPAHLWADDL